MLVQAGEFGGRLRLFAMGGGKVVIEASQLVVPDVVALFGDVPLQCVLFQQGSDHRRILGAGG